jgi:hypothetical protein
MKVEAGRPAALKRLASVKLGHAYRTWIGCGTAVDRTRTEAPSMVASAGWK